MNPIVVAVAITAFVPRKKDNRGIARAAGADHVIVESGGNFAKEVLQLTSGEGVQVVYAGSGAVTFDDSLASLRRHGVLTYYGPVLGSPKPIDIATLRRERLSVDKTQQLMRLRVNFAIGMLP